MNRPVAELPEVTAAIATTPHTRCPDWCELPEHAETHVGTWHEGATTRVVLASGESPINCDVSEGGDWTGDSWDLRLSISAEAGVVSVTEAREFAAGVLRAADLLERLSVERATS